MYSFFEEQLGVNQPIQNNKNKKRGTAFAPGGRLIYCGAGTSGRLVMLDASECPPTYGTLREMVVGLIAGGNTAILQAVENAKDSRTPYVLGAMAYARHVGASVVAISCNQNSEMSKAAISPLNRWSARKLSPDHHG